MISRAFAQTDSPKLHALVCACWQARGPLSPMHIGDLYWTALRPRPGADCERDLRVWERDGELIALSWFDAPDSGEMLVHPDIGAAPSEDEMLDRLEERRSEDLADGQGAFTIGVVEGDEERGALLERRGYQRTASGLRRFWRALDAAPVSAPLPPGYAIGSVDGDPKRTNERVAVQRSSFVGSTSTIDTWRALREFRAYRADLDLLVVTADGSGASGCTCWYDEMNTCGEFEPVGTAVEFQRRGLGKAVVIEGLRRLHSRGATQAIVMTNETNEAAISLYESCGFHSVGTQWNFERRWT